MSLAILISGGLDSAILLGDALRRGEEIHPLFLRCGLYWENVELTYLRRFLAAVARPSLRSLTILEQPVADLYGRHWSLTGEKVPDASTPDEAVFLPGRNVLLLTKALLWCHLHDVPAVALGVLGSNPFPDATPEFFAALENVVNQAVAGQVRVLRPFAGLHKADVMKLGQGLPLEHSFSCIDPKNDLHCGLCNKCEERRRAFVDAGLRDPTRYASQ
jgi:7-cyano-7-deazaguanine synthase